MNQYGQMAMEHWERHAPSRLAELENKETFFRELGETAAGQIASLSEQMEAAAPSAVEYLDRVAQLASIRRTAEEIVLNDLVFSVEAEPETAWEELEDLLGQLPEASEIRSIMQEIRDAAALDSERQGWSEVSLSEDDRASIARLTQLLELVQLPMEASEMPAGEVAARIEALRPFLSQIR